MSAPAALRVMISRPSAPLHRCVPAVPCAHRASRSISCVDTIVVVLAQVGSAPRDLRRGARHPPRRSQYRPLTFAVIADKAIKLAVPESLIADHIEGCGALARRHTRRPQPMREVLGVVAYG